MSERDARQAITEALHTYCRGIDRLDADLVRAAFHPGAELVDYGPEPMTIERFAEHAIAALGTRFVATQHRISNLSIELDGTTARAEAYVMAFHVEDGDDGKVLHTFNGRYVDHHEQRDGTWKIAKRFLRVDWSTVEPITGEMSGAWVASGRGGTPDPWFD